MIYIYMYVVKYLFLDSAEHMLAGPDKLKFNLFAWCSISASITFLNITYGIWPN